MCIGSTPSVQAAPAPAPVVAPPPTAPVAPMASPEDTINKQNTTGSQRLATRRSLRIDLAGSPTSGGASGLNIPQ